LKPIAIIYPEFSINYDAIVGSIDKLGEIVSTNNMTQKKICFFGDSNKIIMYDLEKETWKVKTLNKTANEFLYYAASVSMPNGDALITGGGSSTSVYQFTA
jgi:hypothetical protein